MELDRRGCIVQPRPRPTEANWQQEEPVDEVKPAARLPTVEHREPCELRGSRTVLGAPGGEIPPGDSSKASVRCVAVVRPKSGVKQTCRHRSNDAIDPERSSAINFTATCHGWKDRRMGCPTRTRIAASALVLATAMNSQLPANAKMPLFARSPLIVLAQATVPPTGMMDSQHPMPMNERYLKRFPQPAQSRRSRWSAGARP